MSRSSTSAGPLYLLSLAAVGLALLSLPLSAEGQRRRSNEGSRSRDDTVFAIAFSPDGQTLAIARGAGEPVHRYGRVELWDTETGKIRHIIQGFDGPVNSISFSPDGLTLISTSVEFRIPKIQQKARSREGQSFGELKWWDPRTGELKKKLTMPGEDSNSFLATLSPDGKQLATAEFFWDQVRYFGSPLFDTQGPGLADGSFNRASWARPLFRIEMKLVDAQTGELRFKLGADRPGAAGFSPDGNLLAMANGKEVKLWNAQTGKEMRKLKNLRGAANAVAFSPNGRTLAVASTQFAREYTDRLIKIIAYSEVRLFDVGSGRVTLWLKNVGAVNGLAFGPDGRVLVVGGVLPENGGQSAGVKVFDLQTGKVANLPTGADYQDAVQYLAISRNGNLLAFSSSKGTVTLFDTITGASKYSWDANSVGDAIEKPANRFVLSVTRVLAVAFSADGLTVSGESDHGEIKSWDHRTGEVKRHLSVEQDDPSLVAASTDGKAFAEVSQGELLFWNGDSDTKRTVPLPGLHTISGLALSGDGQTLAVASGSDVTLLTPAGKVSKKLSGLEGSVGRVAFSSDSHLLAGADEAGVISIWNVASGRIEKTLKTSTEITALVFAPNGGRLATAAADNTVSVWSLDTGLPQRKFQKHDGTINALAFSPNGQLLASGGDDRTIVLWEVAAGKAIRTFKGHDQTVTSLAFSPDSRLLASGSGNASVVLWEVSTGKLNRVLR